MTINLPSVLLRPATTTSPSRIRWRYAVGIPLLHVLAGLALFPYLFSWSGLVLAVIGLYVFGTLGINLCYHRLLTHRSFAVPLWLEHSLAIISLCTLQDTPACWAAMHRLHHKESDHQEDPHSPWVSLLWGHCGWLMFDNREFTNLNYYQRYSRDLLRDPFYMRLERGGAWFLTYVSHAVLFFLAGWLVGGMQFGLSLLVWGVFVRTIAVWHITWSVNSLGHVFGYQNYETGDSSRNNLLIGLYSNGDGWHNNHHADPRAASHGHRWFELDVTYLTILLLRRLGLAWDIVPTRLHSGSTADGQTKLD